MEAPNTLFLSDLTHKAATLIGVNCDAIDVTILAAWINLNDVAPRYVVVENETGIV